MSDLKLTPQILAMYLGCEVQLNSGRIGRNTYVSPGGTVHVLVDTDFGPDAPRKTREYSTSFPIANCKPILRRLSSMTEEEARELIMKLFNAGDRLSDEDKILPDELGVHNMEIAHNDGGLMVDEDCAVVVDLHCRCFEGQVAIMNCGSILLFDDDGELQRMENVPVAFAYLLSKSFDLFGLIDANLAIEKQ